MDGVFKGRLWGRIRRLYNLKTTWTISIMMAMGEKPGHLGFPGKLAMTEGCKHRLQ